MRGDRDASHGLAPAMTASSDQEERLLGLEHRRLDRGRRQPQRRRSEYEALRAPAAGCTRNARPGLRGPRARLRRSPAALGGRGRRRSPTTSNRAIRPTSSSRPAPGRLPPDWSPRHSRRLQRPPGELRRVRSESCSPRTPRSSLSPRPSRHRRPEPGVSAPSRPTRPTLKGHPAGFRAAAGQRLAGAAPTPTSRAPRWRLPQVAGRRRR